MSGITHYDHQSGGRRIKRRIIRGFNGFVGGLVFRLILQLLLD